jgi:hypothetical protein
MTNGNSKLLYWLLSLFAAIIISLASAWAVGVDRKLERLADVHEELRPRTAVIEQRVKNLEDNMDSINGKLDRLLQRGNR